MKQLKKPSIEKNSARKQIAIEEWVARFLGKVRKERKKEMSDLITSYVRTAVPILVGALAAWLAQKGFTVPEELVTATSGLLTALFALAYYAIVRKLEQKWPKLGVLLGVPASPTYK